MAYTPADASKTKGGPVEVGPPGRLAKIWLHLLAIYFSLQVDASGFAEWLP
jgi:hypothetical protein